ncbi:MAG TPA: DUF2304 domain-containing protein [Candidatus Cloacimonadota bacterium]|nr:DUF2304 domain-containing protein [Candidatus Cloacimonadota bacterium]
MGLKVKLIALFLGLLFSIIIYRSIKKSYLTPVLSLIWISLAVFFLSIPLLEPLYKWISVKIIGISDARHLIYIAIIGLLLVFVLYLSIKVSRLHDQNQMLISFTAILDKEIRDLKKLVGKDLE